MLFMNMQDIIMSDILICLVVVFEECKNVVFDSFYVVSLYYKGLNKILEKVGEELVEIIIVVKDVVVSGDCQDLIYEIVDFWFYLLVMFLVFGQYL